ncbi:MAG: GNAT family N-acetyltransferase [Pseudonocardia sp.]|nr:GNAT family N-acetyltransferase [Pseudonocardia sp.]
MIRRAEPADLDAIRAIFRAASLSNEGDRATLLTHPEVLEFAGDAVAEGRVRVAVLGAVAGFATFSPGADAWELDDLFVDPAHMRRGVATALVRHLQGEADVPWIEVTANPHAMAFYRSVGFVDDGVAKTRFGPAPRP